MHKPTRHAPQLDQAHHLGEMAGATDASCVVVIALLTVPVINGSSKGPVAFGEILTISVVGVLHDASPGVGLCGRSNTGAPLEGRSSVAGTVLVVLLKHALQHCRIVEQQEQQCTSRMQGKAQRPADLLVQASWWGPAQCRVGARDRC